MPDGGAFVWPQVPAQARRLADVLGPDALLRLIEKRGGTSVVVGKAGTTRDTAKLLGLSGSELNALRHEFHDERIKVPLLREWRARVYRQRNMSYSEIALKIGITDSQVWYYLRNAELTVYPGASPSNQLSLDV